jgi:hypothetical protein
VVPPRSPDAEVPPRAASGAASAGAAPADPPPPAQGAPAAFAATLAGETQAQPPAAAPTAAAPAAPAPTARGPAPTAAAQVAPALLSMGQGSDGGQNMTLRLQPHEMGMVQVRIERSEAGVAHVTISADKPDTLEALQRDQADLHRTLDQAGVSGLGRTVTFALAAVPQGDPAANPSLGHANQHAAPNGAQTGAGDSAQAGGGRSGEPSSNSNAYAGPRRQDGQQPPSREPGQAGNDAWVRVGLDITA